MQATIKYCLTATAFTARKIVPLGVFLGAMSTAIIGHATVIADWTFETTLPATAGPFSPEVGAGSATGSHANASTYSSPVGNGSNHSFSSNGWSVNDYYQFLVNTTGVSNITFAWDQTSSGTGPKDFLVEYSPDGSSFVTAESFSVLANAAPNTPWTFSADNPSYSMSVDLSSITALYNDPTVYIRLVDADTVSAANGTVGTAGTDRVDNVIVSGTALATPEPSGIVLAVIGAASLVLTAIRRRRR